MDRNGHSWIPIMLPQEQLVSSRVLYQIFDSCNRFFLAIPSTTYLRYFEICQNILKGWTRYWDDVQKAPIAYGDGMWTGYEDSQSIQEKIDYLNENELGGAMIWEMSMDDAG